MENIHAKRKISRNWVDEDKKNPSGSLPDETIKEVAKFDLKCREELHKLQVANEEKKARNLDMEYKALLKKYEILEAQMDCLKKAL